ncbi:MAG: efflux RND transporter permease subunit, partial [Hyphomicrobiaceae bacterium]|nr:efflux RND transporter permease subunit [Hyphomicrobiaceae bacterium]
MNPSALFIARPVGTTLLAIGLTILGIAAFFAMPVASLPSVEFPTIRVQAARPGADPEVMASTVA